MATRESLKEKYWNGQIKSMLGPCMITFAIPITIPGVTITLVAFSDERSLPKYGSLHVTGLILLIVAVLLILVGCVLKYLWKPFIPDDIEMQLTPYSSFRRPSGAARNKLDGIYTDRNSKPTKENEKRDRDSDISKRQSSNVPVVHPVETKLDEIQRQTEDLSSNMSRYSNETPSCSGLSGVNVVSGAIGSDLSTINQIDSDDVNGSKFGTHSSRTNSHLAPIDRLPSSSRRQLPPISPRPLTSQDPLEGNPSLDEIQSWRKKKKKRKRQSSDISTEVDEYDLGVINQGSDCDDDSLKEVKSKLSVTQEAEDISGGSARSSRSNRSLLEDESKEKGNTEKKQKRRKRKKKRLSSLKQSSIDKDVEEVTRSSEKEDMDYQRPLRTSQADDNGEGFNNSDN